MSDTRIQGQSMCLRLDQYETVVGELFQNLLGNFYFTPQKSDHVLLLSVMFYYFHHQCLVIDFFCVKPQKVCKVLNTHHSNGFKRLNTI